MTRFKYLLLPLALVVGCGVPMEEETSSTGQATDALVNPDVRPTGRGGGIVNQWANAGGNARPKTSNGISYHGGPVMLGTTNIYYIWYGNWSGNTRDDDPHRLREQHRRLAVLQHQHHLLRRRRTPTCRTRSRSAARPPTATRRAPRSPTRRSRRSSRRRSSSGRLPHGHERRLLRAHLGGRDRVERLLHPVLRLAHHGTISAACDIKYSFVGNPDRCLVVAARTQSVGPNGNAGADGMASIIAHELEEAVTDPDLNAWYDNRGYENADKCAWTFGTTYTASNGALYNVHARQPRTTSSSATG